MKNRDGTFLEKYLYFHRIDTYCFINYDIKYIFTIIHDIYTEGSVKAFFNETLLVQGKSEILNIFSIRCNNT